MDATTQTVREGGSKRSARTPSARTIARLMTNERDHLNKADTLIVAAVEEKVQTLVEAREIIADFHQIVRVRAIDRFVPWLIRAKESLVVSFANGIIKDEAAARNAIMSPWLDLLQARLIGATRAECCESAVRPPFASVCRDTFQC